MVDFHQLTIDLFPVMNQNLMELNLAEHEGVDLSHKRIYDTCS